MSLPVCALMGSRFSVLYLVFVMVLPMVLSHVMRMYAKVDDLQCLV